MEHIAFIQVWMLIEVEQRKTTLTLLRHQAEARVANEVVASDEES
jgi:hypothetical protein